MIYSVLSDKSVQDSFCSPPRIYVKVKDGTVRDYWSVHLMGLEQGHRATAQAALTKVGPSARISQIRTLVSPLRKTAVINKLWQLSPPHSSSKLQSNILCLSQQESSEKEEEKSSDFTSAFALHPGWPC